MSTCPQCGLRMPDTASATRVCSTCEMIDRYDPDIDQLRADNERLKSELASEREAHEATKRELAEYKIPGICKYVKDAMVLEGKEEEDSCKHIALRRLAERELAELNERLEKAPVRWLLRHPDGYTQLLGWLRGVKAESPLVDISGLDGKRVKIVRVYE